MLNDASCIRPDEIRKHMVQKNLMIMNKLH